MSLYALVVDGSVTKYPYTLTDLIRSHPTVSFAVPISSEVAERFGVFGVAETPQPEYDSELQNLVWADPILDNGVWVQQWEVTDASAEEIAQRLEQKRQSMVVTPFQAKAALLDAGLLDDIETLMADPATDRTVVLAWNNVTEFRRLSPMIAGIASALGWTDEQLDSLFEAAALISA